MPHHSIGVTPGNYQDLTGKEFDRLTVISRDRQDSKGQFYWNCLCSCGKTKTVRGGNLTHGKVRSCGCFRVEATTKNKTIHGMADTIEHITWMAISQRCSNPNYPKYQNYGGRGIYVCSGWLSSFQSFFDDMGLRPSSKHSIDRIDNEKGYQCGHCEECISKGNKKNCRWATRKEQGNNKRNNVFIEWNNQIKTQSQWSDETGISRETIANRLKWGWSPEKIFTTPVRKHKRS